MTPSLKYWRSMKEKDRETLETGLLKSALKHPAALPVLDRLVEYLEYRQFQKLNDGLWLQCGTDEVRGYCEALKHITSRLNRLIKQAREGGDDGRID